MKKGKDISAKFKELYLVHQNLPGKKTIISSYSEHILFIPLQGEISIYLKNEPITFGLGQMLYLPPGTEHSFSSSEKFGERLIAMLDAKSLSKTANLKPQKLPLNQFIKEMLFYLLLHPATKSAKHLIPVFSETLVEAMEESDASVSFLTDHLESKTFDPRVKQSLSFMQANLSDKFSMLEVAAKSGLSLRNFNRLFMEETGLQPKKWLINYRIEKAKELLKVPGSSVTEVAFSVGYNSLGQFISAFRARTGQLPSEFLKLG